MKPLPILLCLLLLVLPVMADGEVAINPQVVDYRTIPSISAPFYYHGGEEGLLISRVGMILYPGESCTFRLGLNDGTSIPGSISLTTDYLVYKTETFTLGSDTHTFSGPWFPGVASFYYITTAISNSTGVPAYSVVMVREQSVSFGGDQSNLANPNILISSDHMVSSSLSAEPSANPPLWFSLDTGSVTSLSLVLSTVDNLYDQEVSHITAGQNFIDWGISVLKELWGILMFVWGIFSFLFIENLMLTLLLIEGGILAYNMNKSPNIFVAMENIIKTNVAIIRFMIEFGKSIVEFAGEVVSLVNPIRWLMGR